MTTKYAIEKRRLVAAYLIAPLVPTIFMLFFPYLLGTEYIGRHIHALVTLFSLPLSYFSCFIGGLCLIRLFKKRNLLRMPTILIGSMLLGMIAFYLFGFLFSVFLDSKKELLPLLSELLWGGAFGLSVALPFCLIAGISWNAK